MTRVLMVMVFALGVCHQSAAQTSAVSGSRVMSVTGGLGNSMGFVGVQAEKYVRQERASIFGGIGYLPSLESGDSSGAAFAGGVRFFTAGSTHRALIAGSVSLIKFQERCFDDCSVYYGPGVQAGYQFVSRRGITVLTSGGVGYGFGVPAGETGTALVLDIGVGYTWRR